MKGSAIRCSPLQHKWKALYDWYERDKRCKRCGMYLQCFRGKHKYNGSTDRRATCSLCGKAVRRRRRSGVLNPQPH